MVSKKNKRMKEMKYRIGLDLGIASIGWSVIEHDENDRPSRIRDLGVRKFKPAEHPKTGASPCVDRRNARSMRRNIRRKKYRLEKLTKFLKQYLLNETEIDFSPCDIYMLRAKAIHEKITDQELARVLYSIMKHRGFQSNRKSELKDKETSKMLEKVRLNQEELKSYSSVGEMYVNSPKYVETRTKLVDGKEKSYLVYHVRNKGMANFDKSFYRADILNEIDLILTSQQKLGNEKNTDAFINKYKQIFTYQKSYDEGPDLPSPYHVEFNPGNCTYFPDIKRAPKASFQFEYFSALCSINNLKLIVSGEERFLQQQEKEKLQQALLKNGKILFSQIISLLHLPKDTEFKNAQIRKKDPKCFIFMPATSEISKILGISGDAIKLNAETINAIGYTLTMYKSDINRQKAFRENEFTKVLSTEKIDALLALDYSKFGNLSIKALNMLIPYLEQGDGYTAAQEKANLHEPGYEKTKKLIYGNLPELKEPTSPVVRRAISQTIKVVNAIIDAYGSPCAIYIELGREFGRSVKDRKRLETMMTQNTVNNERWRQQLKEMGIAYPNGDDILKLRLYEEQNGTCMYSGKSFETVLGSLKNVFFDNNTQIDHIIPYSKSYDNSLSNKVLVLTSENQLKGNRIPYEYMQNNPEKWAAYQARVLSCYTEKNQKRKRENLLRKELTDAQIQELNNRALKDTQYMATFMKDLFQNHLLFADSSLRKKPVRTVNGAMTSLLRRVWGIPKQRFASDWHHAEDAAIIACTDAHMIEGVTRFLQFNRYASYVDPETGEKKDVHAIIQEMQIASMPYPTFREELKIRLDKGVLHRLQELMVLGYTDEELKAVRPVLTSRMVNHKLKGAIHEATIYSDKLHMKKNGKKIVTVKTPLNKLKLNKNLEIEGYPEQLKRDDRLLYQALRERLITAPDKAHAFDEPFYKPTKTGLNQNIVKSVKIEKTISGEMELNGGLTCNESMIRIDIFKRDNKYYFIPVYVSDYYHKNLPKHICSCGTWPELDDSYQFQFSLFQNDIIHLKMTKPFEMYPMDKASKKQNKQEEINEKKGEEQDEKKRTDAVLCDDEYFYYIGADRSVASIEIQTLNGELTKRSLGIQKAVVFEKCQIDMLGNLSKVKNETRREF